MKNNRAILTVLNVLFIFLFVHDLSGKVNPRPGENLWRLVARIGDCVDVADSKLDILDSQNDAICSKLEELSFSVVDGLDTDIICSKIDNLDEDLEAHDTLICSKVDEVSEKQDLLSSKIDVLGDVSSCDVLIFQTDIPFVIESPGVYCLAESVSFFSDTAITIASDNVLLDLQDKKIDGSPGGSVGIAVQSGLSNITIQNGVLCNMDDVGIDADGTNNITLFSMSVMDSFIDMPVAVEPIQCLQIKDVKVLNVGCFKEFPIVSTLDSLVDSIVDTPECVISPIVGININCATKVTLDNCQTLCCLGDGFALQMTENCLINKSHAIQNGGNGFVLTNVDTTCLKWCKANMNCFNGFCDFACNGDNLYSGCIAKQNGIDGFHITGGGKVLKKCTASQNTRDGFGLATTLSNDGDLDTTFGQDGTVVTNFGGTRNDEGRAVAMQKDGKIVVAGELNTPVGLDFAVARYNGDGSLDVTFGQNGKVVTNFGGTRDQGFAVAIQKDGKIVVAGQSNAEGDNDFAVARYNGDGSLDVTFGQDGIVTTDFGDSDDRGRAVAIQKDGKIVVAGLSIAGGDRDFAVVRYNGDGSLDVTFGQDGTVLTGFGETRDSGRAVAIQKDGKIVVAGTSSATVTSEDFAVARYNGDGSLDVTFGQNGIVTTDFGGTFHSGHAVAIQKDGKIVVAGQSNTGGDEDFAVARYNGDGSLDVTFGQNGTVLTDFGETRDQGFAVAIQKDGKIVVAGVSNDGENPDFAVARYNGDGSLDVTFGQDGRVITDFGGDTDIGNAVAIQKDGKIVVVGRSSTVGVSDFTVARYLVSKRGVVVRDCIAQENGEDGFNIFGTTYAVRNSFAIHNVLDGFLLESLTDNCQLLNNEALQNGDIGIENRGVDNKIFNSRAHDNAGGNYAGVSLVTTATTSTGFWANVDMTD